ncbi:MAG: hypothetical protein IPK64_02205 [bacterium]|nr:hypothetical protein [bacterium]
MTQRCLSRRAAALLAAAVFVGAVSAVSTARATLGPPVKVTLLGRPAAAEAGKVWNGQLEIAVALPVALTSFRLEGPSWNSPRLDAPAIAEMQKSESLLVAVSALPDDPDQPLRFSFDVDGHTFTKTLDLSARNAARALKPGASQQSTTAVATPVTGKQWEVTGPGPVATELTAPQPAGGQKTNARNIRVHGRIYYLRNDNREVGADHCTIKVCDYNAPFDATLAVGTTDSDGNYDITFYYNGCWNCGENPDLYVTYEAQNGRVRVEDTTWENAYAWNTPIRYDFSGTDADFGDYRPLFHSDQAALHVLTNVTRTWRWLYDYRGYDTAGLDVQWPEGSGAWYFSFFGEMHVGADRQWEESTLSHEYGHHWMAKYSWDNIPGYCNGICDGSAPLNCGHCIWCPEDQGIAWSEGFPNWLGWLIPSSYEADYGLKARNIYDFEGLTNCHLGDSYLGDPLLTEGFVAALLQDITDTTAGDSHSQFPGYPDALAVGNGPIFVCVDYDTPTSVMDFLMKFKARYAGWAEQIWQTAKNCGYEFDLMPPSVVSGLTSPSHVTTGDSPDPTIDFTWNRPTDDASGVAGYAVLVSSGGPAMPPTSMSVGNVTTYTTTTLAPGTYWFNLRPIDRAGRWALAQTSLGPFTIRVAEPSNLAFRTLPGWGSVVVPRGAADAAAGNVPLPSTLTGDAASTWWNTAFQNTGDVATSTFFQVNGLVDGVQASGWGVGGPLGGLTSMTALNLGAMTVRGGRHVFEVRLDASDLIPELNENDNRWARQWAWAPPTMASLTPLTRAAPPARTGGWSSIGEGSYTDNCDGLRMAATGWWNAVAINPADNTNDYDLYLYATSTNPIDGFTSSAAGSGRLAGWLDAVITNRNVLGNASWDVGVVNYSGGSGSYAATHHTNYGINFDAAPGAVTLAAGEMLRLWEFYVAPASAGPITLVATTGTPSRPVTVAWLSQAFTVGGLGSASAQLKTDASGIARLDIPAASSGYHALVVYRDPRDGTAALPITVEVGRSKPDLLPVTLSGWAAPLVPRPAADGTVWTVAAPDTLIGNSAATWLNFVAENQGLVDAAPQTTIVDLDGVGSWPYQVGAMPAAGGRVFVNEATPVTVRGGRHTLALRTDATAQVAEVSETNNAWGAQYAWSPFLLPYDELHERAGPPDPTGGWSQIAGTVPLYDNCDGLRLPAGSTRWRGLAAIADEGGDVDLWLHAPMTDPLNGFSTVLAMFGWGRGALDFLVVNDDRAGNGVFDVGATTFEGADFYLSEAVDAVPMELNRAGYSEPTEFEGYQLLHLRTVDLDEGTWHVRLISLEGDVDWGLSVYSSELPYAGKSTVLGGALAFQNGEGLDESFTMQVPHAGLQCLAVWKVGLADVAKAGAYRVQITRGVSTVPDDTPPTPLASALVDVRPNPFNPRTTVTFELAAAARAQLAVYDLRGALVRSLVDAGLPAGRHTAVWDGCDQTGQSAASGVYVARFTAGNVRDIKRMVLIR